MNTSKTAAKTHRIFINFKVLICVFSEKNQLEDPRQQWRTEQELMLKDYLVTAQDDLEVRLKYT